MYWMLALMSRVTVAATHFVGTSDKSTIKPDCHQIYTLTKILKLIIFLINLDKLGHALLYVINKFSKLELKMVNLIENYKAARTLKINNLYGGCSETIETFHLFFVLKLSQSNLEYTFIKKNSSSTGISRIHILNYQM